jgi:hypothetical protein
MRSFWWQGGLHLEPETDSERSALVKIGEGLEALGLLGSQFFNQPKSGPVAGGNLSNQEAVIGVHELPEVVA